MARYFYTIFRTQYGYMGIVKTLDGLHTIILPQKTEKEIEERLLKKFKEKLIRDDFYLSSIRIKIENYFLGRFIRFNEDIDFSQTTEFDRKVWEVVLSIPRGEVRSYSWVAKKIGKPGATRAVGQALTRNRLPIVIPCHRVIRKNGDIGGYSFGPNMKRLLLKIEGRLL